MSPSGGDEKCWKFRRQLRFLVFLQLSFLFHQHSICSLGSHAIPFDWYIVSLSGRIVWAGPRQRRVSVGARQRERQADRQSRR